MIVAGWANTEVVDVDDTNTKFDERNMLMSSYQSWTTTLLALNLCQRADIKCTETFHGPA
jgi:hypothetical protein